MKCKVCGAESGKYPLCKECNKKKEAGEIIKCPQCQKWHYVNVPCIEEKEVAGVNDQFLYELKYSLVTRTEMEYLSCIKTVLPENYLVQAQANLASFIVRTDDSRFQNELYRNVDFIITDLDYRPLVVIEINDQTHNTKDRRDRDKKVANICEEAGIPIIKLWTSYGVNQEYIKKRITETLSSLPVKRVHHFVKEKAPEKHISPVQTTEIPTGKKNGCYIATCVYGSYDCPQVWTLRRFRDSNLRRSWFGCIFIKVYYAVSPVLVKMFGDKKLFKALGKKCLDVLILWLQAKGIEDTPYTDVR
ncbi:MAG: DUF2726 domain-containing protein [Lachnospiraceae bacterium]|nr:DUF2726 domain-containing protein [Lachnospiraceae bacterium]